MTQADELLAAVVSMRVDEMLRQVAPALDAGKIDWILLKGAVIRQRLYPDGARDYRDLDLLVDPNAEAQTYRCLEALGFNAQEGYGEPERIALHHEWRRGDDIVEVHVTLSGADAEPAAVWRALAQRRRTIRIGAVEVSALDDVGLALHLALHATHHGVKVEKGMEDLRRGAEMLPVAAWHDATLLAERIGALPAFVAGLRLLPEDRRPLADLPDVITAEAALKSQSAHPVAVGFARASRSAGGQGIVRRLPRVLFPSRAFLRRWSRTYYNRTMPYPVAWARRIGQLARHGVPALIAWRAAERSAHKNREPAR